MGELKIVFVGGAFWYGWADARFVYVEHEHDIPKDADAVLVWSGRASMWITKSNNLGTAMPRIANHYGAQGIIDLLTV